mgnify:CR=1 FL=1
MTRLLEQTLQQAFLDLLQAHYLFMDGNARFVHVHEVFAPGTKYWVVQYYQNNAICEASGTYTGDESAGTFFLDWALTPTAGGKVDYHTKHRYPFKWQYVQEEALAELQV